MTIPPRAGILSRWQRNYYEHIIRNQPDHERIANYIATNPVNWENDEER
jgi:REP element-mobilizing transposase RayT